MLNSEQLSASQIEAKRSLILAGPGTGKTTALVGRFAHLIKLGVEPKSILCCTFAKKAADELAKRIQVETGINTRGLPIGTFHALAFRLLNANGRDIGMSPPLKVLEEKDRLHAIFEIKKTVGADTLYKDFDSESARPSVILKFIDEVRERLLDPEDASIEASENGELLNVVHSEIYAQYEAWLNRSDKIDFPRMIQWACKLLSQDAQNGCKIGSSFQHILVDEYQDVNKAQKTMVDELLKGGGSLWVVGDDDQAIYGWRGSSSKYILDFDKFYPGTKKVTLVRNYRSGEKIVKNANHLINHVSRRHPKELQTDSEAKSTVTVKSCLNETDEALQIARIIKEQFKNGVKPEDIAVLSRTNALPFTVIDVLIAQEIPVVLKDGVQLFAEPVAQELISAVALSCNMKPERGWDRKLPRNIGSFAEKISRDEWPKKVKALATMLVKNSPKNLSDDDLAERLTSIDNYKEYLLSFEDSEEVFRKVRRSALQTKNSNGVHIGTIHKAKGAEWESVFVIGWEDDVLPHARNHGHRGIDEERRLAYVAITRAKSFLMMTYADKRDGVEKKYSRFLDEMPLAFESVSEPNQKSLDKQQKPKPRSKANPISLMTRKYENQIKLMETHDELVARQKVEALSRSTNSTLSRKSNKTDRVKGSNDEDRAFYREINEILAQKKLSKNVADGSGAALDGRIEADDGFLKDSGYNAQKDGPSTRERHQILNDVFEGKIELSPDLKESVAEQWGEANSIERLQKIRNAINFSLGTQKGRTNPSEQAIRKWEADIEFIDVFLAKKLA